MVTLYIVTIQIDIGINMDYAFTLNMDFGSIIWSWKCFKEYYYKIPLKECDH